METGIGAHEGAKGACATKSYIKKRPRTVWPERGEQANTCTKYASAQVGGVSAAAAVAVAAAAAAAAVAVAAAAAAAAAAAEVGPAIGVGDGAQLQGAAPQLQRCQMPEASSMHRRSPPEVVGWIRKTKKTKRKHYLFFSFGIAFAIVKWIESPDYPNN